MLLWTPLIDKMSTGYLVFTRGLLYHRNGRMKGPSTGQKLPFSSNSPTAARLFDAAVPKETTTHERNTAN